MSVFLGTDHRIIPTPDKFSMIFPDGHGFEATEIRCNSADIGIHIDNSGVGIGGNGALSVKDFKTF